MSFLNSLKYVAAAYGSQYDVKVVPSNQAYTDGRIIHTIIDEDNPEATWGFLTHESAHCRFTNFNIKPHIEFKKLQQADPLIKAAKFTTEHFFSLVNGLEDNRIEYSFFQEYPGAFNTFNSMNELLIKQGLWRHEANDNLLSAITDYTALFAPGNLEGMNYSSCKDLSLQVDNHLKSFDDLDKQNYLQIKQIVLNSVKAKSTREVIELAKSLMRLMAKLKNEAKNQDNANQQGKSEQQAQSSDEQTNQSDANQQGESEQQGQNSNEQINQSDANQQGKSEQQGQSSNEQINQTDGKESYTANYDVNEISLNKDKGDLIADFLSQSPTTETIDDSFMNATQDHQSLLPLAPRDISNRYDEGVSCAGSLLRRINNLLEARARTKKANFSTGRKIDRRKIASIKTGNNRVFSRKKENIASNTAIYVTLDVSGSMKTLMQSGSSKLTRVEVATRALSAMSYAISRQKTSSLCIGAFNQRPYDVVDFNEPLGQAKGKLNRLYSEGGTQYVPTMLRGLVKLASQAQQTRKIIILITDGVPSDDAKARVLVENMKASGIEVYCIGIDLKRDAPMVVKNIFGVSCFIEINTAEQLQHEILQLAHACM
jgi:uncharacterized protein YegL